MIPTGFQTHLTQPVGGFQWAVTPMPGELSSGGPLGSLPGAFLPPLLVLPMGCPSALIP